MSADVSTLPDVARLLDAADNALALEKQLGPGGDASRAVDGIFRDLGRAVHRALRDRPQRPVSDLHSWPEDDDDEPTVIDIPDEDEDAGIVTRKRRS